MKKLSSKLILIACLGTIIECYDFTVYGYLVSVIATNFFPTGNRTVALMSAFGVFASGVVFRTLGGFLVGLLSDRLGRMLALRISVGTMVATTAMIGLLPGYKTIGLWAPLALIALRMLQGLSFGGQLSTAMTLLAQEAPLKKRGLATGWLMAAGGVGMMAGSGFAALSAYVFSETQFYDWGWRFVFLIAIIPGLLVMFMGGHVAEFTANAERPKNITIKSMLRLAFGSQSGNMLRTIGSSALFTTSIWIPYFYLPTAIHERGWLPLRHELAVNTGCLLISCILGPLAGWVADRVGHRRALLTSGLIAALAAPLLFHVINQGRPALVIIAQLALPFVFAIPGTVAFLPVIVRFPDSIRGTAFALPYNTAAIFFAGGSLPFTTYMVQRSGSLTAAGWILFTAGLLSLWAWWTCDSPA